MIERYRRILPQSPGQIGERPDRDQLQLTRPLLPKPHDLIDGGLTGNRTGRLR
jgi:hypothetical protein